MLIIVLLLCLCTGSGITPTTTNNTYQAADIAWMLTATALVLIMTPGLAFFYGGMVNKKNVLSTMLQSFICMGLITVLWVVFGFSLAFGKNIGGVFGSPTSFFMMEGIENKTAWPLAPTIPLVLFAFYQLKFAIITPALITGAFAERIKFTSYLLFICLFVTFVYCPLAHATWHPDGILFKYGVLDFAGGTVVHMSAGWAALVSALYLKRRNNTPAHQPARISYVMLGTGLLWFGWFGFNAGSAYGANSLAATALATTSTASAAAAISWILMDVVFGKKPGAMGTCIGAVVGLVAITPAAGYVSVPHSMVIGIISSFVSNLLVQWRSRTAIDDTLDVFPCHGAGGMVGMLFTGIFASKQVNPTIAENGLFFGGTHLFFVHVVTLVAVSVFVIVATYIILRITDWIAPLRVTEEEEELGLDLSQHGEKL